MTAEFVLADSINLRSVLDSKDQSIDQFIDQSIDQFNDDSVSLILMINPAYQSHRKIAAIWEQLARSVSLIQLKQIQVNTILPNLYLSDKSEPNYEGSFDYPSMLEWVVRMARLIRERPVSTKVHPCSEFSQYGMSC